MSETLSIRRRLKHSRRVRTSSVRVILQNLLALCRAVATYLTTRVIFLPAAISKQPNQTLYDDILNSNVNTLNLSSPTINERSYVIVLVCSKPNDFEIRQTIRRTWASPIHSKAVRKKIVTVIFLIGTGHDNFIAEDEQFGDILRVDVLDSYTNIVYKLLAAYRWIELNYPGKFILKIDSDVVVILDRILNRISSGKAKTIQCYVNQSRKPMRSTASKWYIPPSIYSGHYLPNYCSGPTYLITPATLSAILQASHYAKVIEVEDVFFTGLLARKANIKLQQERGIWHLWKPSQPCVNGLGTVISYPIHSTSAIKLQRAWHHLSNLRCRWFLERIVFSLIFDD
ncbi:N-acetyllactosaminide 3-alpha-galactosyltransferase [Dictyocaulus viviparus]|uniref:Hexosyltransferase n=1 Tax=Dictyocaulus viviparus TaxID=29172 RepID=A0A0D8XG40_DICVI|nr:N-acetyllactosaminide 3-alpha-galactosyltransferase [Dictyocaulus viviparus]